MIFREQVDWREEIIFCDRYVPFVRRSGNTYRVFSSRGGTGGYRGITADSRRTAVPEMLNVSERE